MGAEDYDETGNKKADIPGIMSDEKTRKITIKLEAPDGKFLNVLRFEPFAGPVPPSKAKFEDMTKDPPPGFGPYM